MQSSLTLESMAFLNNDWIPSRHTCEGEGVIPSFRWLHVPDGTQSLVLVMRQREAPPDQQVRWLVYDLPVLPNLIHEGGELPAGAKVGRNDAGDAVYIPPCHLPDHHLVHYDFVLYATDLPTLGLPEGATWAEVRERLRKHRPGPGVEGHVHGDVAAPPADDHMAREWHELGHVIAYAELVGHFAKDVETHVPGVDRI